MILNKTKYIITAICAVLMIACTTRDDEFTPPEGTNAVPFIITSIIEANEARELQSRVGFEAEFLDASIGTKDERTWEFPEGSIEITAGDLNAQKVKVKFLTPGNIDVKLLKKSENGEMLDNLVTVIVYEETAASFTATPTDPNATGFSYNPVTGTIIAEAGTEVQFTTEIKGGLDTFSWKFPGQAPSFTNEQDPIIIFNKLGDSNYNFRAQSSVPFGDIKIPNYLPEADETFYTVKVVPSSKPFVLSGTIVELENEVIQIPFNGEFAPFTNQEEFFSVKLNENGVTRELAIESVERNSTDLTILEITLAEPIYRPDVITVSYNGNGTLQSVDTREPVVFTDVAVEMHDVSQVPAEFADVFDFEGPNTPLTWEQFGPSDVTSLEYTNERASSGTTSLKWSSAGGAGQIRIRCNAPISLAAGKYDITFDVFLEEGNGFASMWPSTEGPFSQQWKDARAAAVPRGQWVTITRSNLEINADSTGTIFFIRTEGGAGTAYLDNVRFVIPESRP